jgi:hypothetical protein
MAQELLQLSNEPSSDKPGQKIPADPHIDAMLELPHEKNSTFFVLLSAQNA